MLRKHLTPGRHDNIAIITTLTSILVNFLSAASVSSSTSSFSTPMTSQPRRLPSALESSSQSPPFGIHLTTLSSSSNRPSYELQVIVMEDGVTSATQTNATSSYCQHLTADEILANFTECLPPLPKGLYFSEDNAVSVAAYSCLFIVAACGNLTVFITLFRNRSSKSRINLFIMHLAIADLIVTFIMLPLEIAWHSTVAWMAGDAACRFFMFFRAMGFYLSSCILVSISLDRYFAIMRPLSITDAGTRAKVMLIVSWCLAIVASIPQSVIFHVETHPIFRWFQQCVTFNFFPSADHELAYNLFSIIALYGLPIAIITSSYCVILCRISKKSRQSKDEMSGKAFEGSHYQLRRSGIGNIERAKTRTLKMTLVIVGAYVMCWTPYFVMSAWYYFDRNSAIKIDPKVQRGLFIFAVSNSCINPIVYGMFTIKFKRELIRCCYCLRGALKRRRMDDSNGIKRSLLFPLKRNSESSTSSRNERHIRAPASVGEGATTPNGQGCRYSFVSPLAEVKTSSSRASLSSVGREERINREAALYSMDRVSLSPSLACLERSSTGNVLIREDRANLNNFIRLA